MTLPQLLSADLATQRQYALVFDQRLADTLTERWQRFGSTNCVPVPTLLANGKYMLSADILSEVSDGRLLGKMWKNSNVQAIVAGTTIMAWSDAVKLVPVVESPA